MIVKKVPMVYDKENECGVWRYGARVSAYIVERVRNFTLDGECFLVT